MNKRIVCGLVFFSLSLVFFLVGLLVYYVGNEKFQDGLKDNLVVSKYEPNKKKYNEWETNNYEGAAPLYSTYTFFNLSNLEEVLNGETPKYHIVGPYVYRKIEDKFDVQFKNDGKEVTYNSQIYYVFQEDHPDNEGKDPKVDQIVNLNHVYAGLISQFGSEKLFVEGLVPETFKGIIGLMNQEYLQGIVALQFPPLLYNLQSKLVNEIIEYNVSDASMEFLEIWANATNDPIYPGFNASMRVSEEFSSNISLSSAVLLFDSSIPYSLTNSSITSSLAWFAAIQDQTIQQQIMLLFQLTPEQFQMILLWRARLAPLFYSEISEIYNVPFNEIGLVQWAQGSITPQGMKAVFPSDDLPVSPEYAIWSKSVQENRTLSLEQTKLLTSGIDSLTSPQGYFAFQNLLVSGNFEAINTIWKLNQEEALSVNSYFQQLVKGIFLQPSLQQIEALILGNSGLFTTRTVDEWLWSGVDPLLQILDPSRDKFSFFLNDTDENVAKQHRLPSTFKTGKSDLDEIMQYVEYEEHAYIDIWADPQPVKGTDGMKFKPGLSDNSKHLDIFVSELLRTVSLEKVKKTKFKKIRLFRYAIDPVALKPDPIFYQAYQGFANMTASYGAPVFLSKPNMKDCDEEWRNKVEGLRVPSDQDETYLDVEPITGATMRATKQLQLNIFVPSREESDLFDLWFTNATTDLFYPLVIVDENSELTDKQAKDFRNAVYQSLLLIVVFFGIGVSLGACCFLVSVVFVIYFFVERRRRGYEIIDQ